MKIYCDGSLIQNNDAAICVKIKNQKPIVKTFRKKYTSMELEYLSLIEALNICNEKDMIFNDNPLVILEIHGLKWVSEKHRLLKEEVLRLKRIKNIRILWVDREQNPAGKVLEGRVDKVHNYLNSQKKYTKEQNKKSKKEEFKQRRYGKNTRKY